MFSKPRKATRLLALLAAAALCLPLAACGTKPAEQPDDPAASSTAAPTTTTSGTTEAPTTAEDTTADTTAATVSMSGTFTVEIDGPQDTYTLDGSGEREFSTEELTVEFPLDDAAPAAQPSDGGGS